MSETHGTETQDKPFTLVTSLAALGIVYGDLGTSPLYTYQAIVGIVGGHPNAADAVGLLSLVVWALIVTVSVKYCIFVMRADYFGEGGILALMALVTAHPKHSKRYRAGLIAMGLFGAALIYGDGIITPAISVLSALEGINIVTESFKPYVMPAAIVVLVGLFVLQRSGTAQIGKIFGPVMAIWFVVIGLLGLIAVLRHPEVLRALDPSRALVFLWGHGTGSLAVLGGVFLAVTGGEALYADMGHLGRASIRVSWYSLVLPALMLSYAGQTALLLDGGDAAGNPFFRLAPGWAIVPLVVLATLATIIASQAIITGAFSLTRQAMQLGWFPGLKIRQTSADEYGQIYVPFVNWAMMFGTLALTLAFRNSDSLAGAYGTAVSTTMLFTTALLFNAMRDLWRWSTVTALLVSGAFLVIDLVFFSANLLKIADGGWIPLALGVLIFLVMTTWHTGIDAIRVALKRQEKSPEAFLADLASGRIPRVPGTGVFLSRSDTAVPLLMVRHATQMVSLPEKLVSLSVRFEQTPRISQDRRAIVREVAPGLWHVMVHFGFVEVPNVTEALAAARDAGCPIDLDQAVYFGARDYVVASTNAPRLSMWRREVFSVMNRNAIHASDRFELPADRFVEIGRQIPL